MSELMNTQNFGRIFHRQLLMSVSALAFLATVGDAREAKGADGDADRPTMWIELGAQSEQVSGFGDPFIPPFTSKVIADGFTSPLKSQNALSQSFGGESRISYQPEKSDWIFSVSVLYGRANGGKSTHDQTPGGKRHVSFVTSSGTLHTGSISPLPNGIAKFSETRASNNETHALLDFQAGKDIGLGLFGGGGQSTVNFGVRFAQFTSKQVLNVIADPDFYFPLDAFHNAKYHHSYIVSSHMERSFRGLGPSVSWNASAPVIGHTDDGGISLDWGANASLLFGRQKTSGHHQTAAAYYKTNEVQKYHFVSHFQRSGNPDRSRTLIVPNVGGFAGASFRFSNAKVSLGYRADFFFGAMDGGIDIARREDRNFYGPFATVSIGIGG